MGKRNSNSTWRRFGVAACGTAGLLWLSAGLNPGFGSDARQIPDFAPGSNTGWIAAGMGFGTDFVQPASGPGPVTNDPRYPYVTNAAAAATGKQPTFRVADLTNPILQPWAAEQMKKSNTDVLAGKIAFTADSRCYPSGVPSFLLFPANPVRFIQTPKEVLMVWQQNAEIRRVYLDVPHSKSPKPSWYGESIGHYENGDTLVVDTIGQNDKTYVDNYRTPHTTQLHVVERFRLIGGGKTIEVNVHVEDPGAFTTPWNAIQRYRRSDAAPMEEMVCAENNTEYFGYDVVPLPRATTPDF
ncbi:MAG TPA: hypothetical protein VFW28_07115 [Micropepsaceae bacterium]|nr:hypothetical protein [Micropepsaceae bacterium]